MGPVTNFAVKDKYQYLYGFNGYHSSEAIPGANSEVINTPQKPAYGLRTERITNSSFTAPREKNIQTWLYRVTSSLAHGEFTPLNENSETANPAAPTHLTPNSYLWPQIPVDDDADWTSQKLMGRNGDPQQKRGLALWLFSVTKDMPVNTAFSTIDGETLIVPQSGALDIQTELGKLLVRQNEIAVIPRNVRYRVALPGGLPARGYIVELFEGHFELPNLGIVGSTGLANVRDFQIPVAYFDGELGDNEKGEKIAKSSTTDGDWKIISRLNGQLWTSTQAQTPFDVVAWHGTCYPYKYDLARFCVFGNVLFDEHDPCLYTVLTAPAHGSGPGTAVLDFAIVPPRWQATENTLWLPYFHRNIMQEFVMMIVNDQSPESPFNNSHNFAPIGGLLNGAMAAHGSGEEEFQAASNDLDTMKPAKLQNDGLSLGLLETERPLYLSKWAYECAFKNFGGKAGGGTSKL